MRKKWRPIPGWPAYAVSECGEIKRIILSKSRFKGLLKTRLKKGYVQVALYDPVSKTTKHRSTHTFVALAFIGPSPSPKHEVAHWDNNRSNNHYTNLRWATRAENCADRIRHGTQNRGERMGRAKLRNSDIHEIRVLLKLGLSCAVIAAINGRASHGAVAAVGSGKSWFWLETPGLWKPRELAATRGRMTKSDASSMAARQLNSRLTADEKTQIGRIAADSTHQKRGIGKYKEHAIAPHAAGQRSMGPLWSKAG